MSAQQVSFYEKDERMKEYIATFFSHFGAMQFRKEAGVDSPVLMPVPRKLSSSCGTCVKFLAPDEYEAPDNTDELIEQIVRIMPDGSYECVYRIDS